MAANEEQLVLVLRLEADHSSYALVVIANTFNVYLWLTLCIKLYLKLIEMQGKGDLSDYEPVDTFELEEANL